MLFAACRWGVRLEVSFFPPWEEKQVEEKRLCSKKSLRKRGQASLCHSLLDISATKTIFLYPAVFSEILLLLLKVLAPLCSLVHSLGQKPTTPPPFHFAWLAVQFLQNYSSVGPLTSRELDKHDSARDCTVRKNLRFNTSGLLRWYRLQASLAARAIWGFIWYVCTLWFVSHLDPWGKDGI